MPVRRGGHATTVTGDRITWTEAEGVRGTRWREAIDRDGQLTRALLLEVSTAGRSTRLEISGAAGLLTLHPETDESAIHGNVVAAEGVRHLAFPWSAEHELLVLDSPAAATITIRRLAPHLIVGATRNLDVLRIDDALDPRPVPWRVERIARRAWHLRAEDGREERRLTVGDDGHPVLTDEVSWPLET